MRSTVSYRLSRSAPRQTLSNLNPLRFPSHSIEPEKTWIANWGLADDITVCVVNLEHVKGGRLNEAK